MRGEGHPNDIPTLRGLFTSWPSQKRSLVPEIVAFRDAERLGTQLYLENMPFAFLPGAESLMAALERHGDERIAVVYDVANAVFIGEDPSDGLRRVRDRLKLVHLSDTPREVYRHSPIGEGVVPFAALPPLLAEVGYAGLPMLEIIAPDPDQAIQTSVQRLLALGWPSRG